MLKKTEKLVLVLTQQGEHGAINKYNVITCILRINERKINFPESFGDALLW